MAVELGPDILCLQLDEARSLLEVSRPISSSQNSTQGSGEDGISEEVKEAQAVAVHLRELVHIHREWLRRGSLRAVAEEAAPNLCKIVHDRVLGPAGLLPVAQLAISRGGGAEGVDLAVIAKALQACELCSRLKLLPSEKLVGAGAELAEFLTAYTLDSRAEARLWRRVQRDAAAADALAEMEGAGAAVSTRSLLLNTLTLRCLASVAGAGSRRAASSVVRMTVEASFAPGAAEVLRSGILGLLRTQLPGTLLRAIRVEPAEGAAMDGRSSGRTLVDVAIESSPRGPMKDGKCLSETFADLSSTFAIAARSRFGISSVSILNHCVFLSLFLAPKASADWESEISGDEHTGGFVGQNRSDGRIGEQDGSGMISAPSTARQLLCRRLRDNLSDALALPRGVIRVVRLGSCLCRAVVELAAIEGLVRRILY